MTDLRFFEGVQGCLEEEDRCRESIRATVRELQQSCRSIAALLNHVHSASCADDLNKTARAASPRFAKVQSDIQELAKHVPAGQYYRYNGMWYFALQQAVFLAAYTTYLQTEKLITTAEVEALLGIPVSLDGQEPNFHVGIEDLLHGMVSLTSELSRLAVNCVTYGDFSRPLRLSKFVGELYSGFQLLNLKNDSLRKRFDSIKYDIKKIEEVVYDISVRGLVKKEGLPEALSSSS